jgi:hypothetical protein
MKLTAALAALLFKICGFIGENGAPGEIRTPDPLVRSQMLYPAELRARAAILPLVWADRGRYCLAQSYRPAGYVRSFPFHGDPLDDYGGAWDRYSARREIWM